MKNINWPKSWPMVSTIISFAGVLLFSLTYRMDFVKRLPEFWSNSNGNLKQAVVLTVLFSLAQVILSYRQNVSMGKAILFSFLLPLISVSLSSKYLTYIFIIFGYFLLLWHFVEIITRRFNLSYIYYKTVVFLVINLFFGIIFVYLHGSRNIVSITLSICGWILFYVYGAKKWEFNDLAFLSYPLRALTKAEQGFLFILFSLAGYIAGAMLHQPILEWDSSLGHVPTVQFYFSNHTLKANPYNIQTYAHGFHHVSAIPLFSIASELGLRFWNFTQVLFVFINGLALGRSILSIESDNRKEDSSPILLIFTSLMVVTIPLVYSTIGTFQYDVPLILIFQLGLLIMLDIIHTKSDYQRQAFLMSILVLVGFIGLVIKMSFIAIAPLFILFYVAQALKRKKLFLKAIFMGIGLLIIFLMIPYIRSRSIFYPYDYISSVSKGDWDSYGLFKNRILDLIFYLPGITFWTEKFGQAPVFAAGVTSFITAIVVGLNLGSKKYIKYAFFLIFVLILGTFVTRYIRYSMYIWALLPLLLNLFLLDLSLVGKKILVTLFAASVIFQLISLPSLNWWVKVPESVMSDSFDEEKLRANFRGKAWGDLIKVGEYLDRMQKKAVIISRDHASQYFWSSMIQPYNIHPLTWQSGLLASVPKTMEELNNILAYFKVDLIVLPKSEKDRTLNLIPLTKLDFENDTFEILTLNKTQ